MRKYCWLALLPLMALSCNNQHNKKSAEENKTNLVAKKENWEFIFDGVSTKGWHRYGGGAIDSVWQVQDGVLFLDTAYKRQNKAKGDWDIVTDNEYDNFELQLEWKISRKGNSGIILYIHEDRSKYRWPWETGMEMQVLDNDEHPDGKFPKHRAGDLYDLISVARETVKPVGEWNAVTIRSLNGQLDMFLNGEKVISTMLWDDSWKNLVAGSKFKNMPDFGTYKKGRIGLQDHGDNVWYRNIRIRRL